MTTIAWDGNMLAGDRIVSVDGNIAGEVTKVFKRKDGCLVAYAGVAGTGAEYARWFLKGEKGKAPSLSSITPNNGADILIIRKDKRLEWYDKDGWHYVENDKFAMGSGAMAARAAMKMGAFADKAVQVASELDVYTGYKVDFVRHDS